MTERFENMSEQNSQELTLSPEDAAIVDAVLGTHESVEDSPRAERVRALLSAVGAAAAPQAAADLGARTLARLQAERMRISAAPRKNESVAASFGPLGLRYLREFAAMAVAASLLGMVVILGVGQARQSARRVACATNLMTFTTAFATHAASNHDELPALARSSDGNWLRPDPAVTDGHTNVDNLLPLMNASLIRPANLICSGRSDIAGGVDRARGYSYVNMFGAHPPTWDHTHGTIVLADRNPLFDPAATIDPQSNSANHGRRGNYVVRADGSATWETSPNVGVGRDNIWTIGAGPQYQTAFAGTETAASASDTFLSP